MSLMSFKKYKRIYKNATFKGYMWNYLLYTPKKWLRMPYCTYMCIKYPFLYPRNRFTDKHYNNWKILDFANKIYTKYCFTLDSSNVDEKCYYKKHIIKDMFTAWKNWWAKPTRKMILFFHDYILQIFHCLPTSIEWDYMEKGWRKAFGKQYLKEIKKQLKKDKCLYSWRIMDIKEKWGRLQLYCNFGSKDLFALIDKYEDLSWNTCIKCGKPSTKISMGYILPYCDECAKENDSHYGYTQKDEDIVML